MSRSESISKKIQKALLSEIEELGGIQNIGRNGFFTLKHILDSNDKLYPTPGSRERRALTQLIQRLKQKLPGDYHAYLKPLGITPFELRNQSNQKEASLTELFDRIKISDMPSTRSKSSKYSSKKRADDDDDDSSLSGKFSCLAVWLLPSFSFSQWFLCLACFVDTQTLGTAVLALLGG